MIQPSLKHPAPYLQAQTSTYASVHIPFILESAHHSHCLRLYSLISGPDTLPTVTPAYSESDNDIEGGTAASLVLGTTDMLMKVVLHILHVLRQLVILYYSICMYCMTDRYRHD